ncbi:hypothetical protein ACHAWU_007849 [Discostella pseudostelligera]|uniref:Tyrosine-protein kinase ephrin type A/B receptor-like domain-containing protein n=1 Tax=Discostella pseudostelligera TaxID=259834 RepID=A0ABD3MAH3_9STRA
MKNWSIHFLLLMVQSCFAEMPYWYWYSTPEEIATFENGKVATLACPVGTYRDFRFGTGQAGCIPCPPGRYGSSIHLSNPMCTAACPRGTFLGAHPL